MLRRACELPEALGFRFSSVGFRKSVVMIKKLELSKYHRMPLTTTFVYFPYQYTVRHNRPYNCCVEPVSYPSRKFPSGPHHYFTQVKCCSCFLYPIIQSFVSTKAFCPKLVPSSLLYLLSLACQDPEKWG